METEVNSDFPLGELPEGCIANIISLTTPQDACSLSLVSKTFLSAAESDTVWERFLPSDYVSILSQFPLLASLSKKNLYFTLCPTIFDDGKKSFQLDGRSGKKCYMLSSRDLSIAWGDTPMYWDWKTLPESRFELVAELLKVSWLEIRGKISTCMLSSKTRYAAYLVFKLRDGWFFGYRPPVVSVGILGGHSSTENVCLDPTMDDDDDDQRFVLQRNDDNVDDDDDDDDDVDDDDDDDDNDDVEDDDHDEDELFVGLQRDDDDVEDDDYDDDDQRFVGLQRNDDDVDYDDHNDDDQQFVGLQHDDDDVDEDDHDHDDDNDQLFVGLQRDDDDVDDHDHDDDDDDDQRFVGLQRPKERNDGWLEIKMGDFFNLGEEDEQLEMSLLEEKCQYWKDGLVLLGIEVRPEEDN